MFGRFGRIQYVALAILVAIVFSLASTVALAQTGRVFFSDWVFIRKLTVQNGGMSIQGGGMSIDSGGMVVRGDIVQSDGDVTIADDLRLGAQSAVSVTQGMTIVAAGTYQPLESAGNVSTGAIAAGATGQMLHLINTSSTTITISDTGTLILSGNIALGQGDSLSLISDGVNWIQLATSNN